jgi:hypothetical protein
VKLQKVQELERFQEGSGSPHLRGHRSILDKKTNKVVLKKPLSGMDEWMDGCLLLAVNIGCHG